MEETLNLIFNERLVLLFSLFISIYVALFALMITMRKSRYRREKSDKEYAYELLLKGNEQNTLNDGSISLIYKRCISKRYEHISYMDFLESFLMYVRQKDEDGTLTQSISKIIEPILEKEKIEKPFSNIKERERRLLLAVENSASKGETSSLKNNLTDLSIVIENNQKALDRARAINRWSIPISVIGILLTLFIWLYGSSLSDKDVQRISAQICTTLSDSLYTVKPDSIK
jgi:hypothetical protein